MYVSLIKPLIDKIVALALLLSLSPLFIIVIIMIKLDSKGPIFFRQRRIGKDMSYFNIFKFRTMVVNNQSDQYTSVNDSRITKVGKVLRTSSIDELPQLIDVLLGRMSLIGPRPSIEREIADYGFEKFERRVRLKPGITGLHQCMFRSNSTVRQKYLIDDFYCRKCSFYLDMKIVWKTIHMIIFKSGSSN